MNHFGQKMLAGLLVVLGGLAGCHQNPALPSSIIPQACRVVQVEYIDTTTHPVFMYLYDALGNRVSSNDDKGIRIYKYDAASEYVTSQQVNGITLTYQYDGTPKQISRIAGGSLSYEYTYDGNSLKTYVVKDGSGTSTYTFSGGKLSTATVSTGETITVSDGKISQRKKANGDVTNYTYAQGQLTQAEFISATDRRVIAYTYDTKSFYTNSGLFFRGLPELETGGSLAGQSVKWQPGPGLDDIGGPMQINNYQTITIKYYTKSSGSETLSSTQTLTYRHVYNQANYSQGYARSDGARAKFYYSNCN